MPADADRPRERDPLLYQGISRTDPSIGRSTEAGADAIYRHSGGGQAVERRMGGGDRRTRLGAERDNSIAARDLGYIRGQETSGTELDGPSHAPLRRHL